MVSNESTQWVTFRDLTNQFFYFKTYENPTLRIIVLTKLDFSGNAIRRLSIVKWKKKLAIDKVGNSGALLQSFQYNVLASAQGNVLKITLLFEYYGRFVDMGVGKGVKIGDVKESATSRRLSGKMLGNRRSPKKWYSKTFHTEVMKLSRP